MPAGPVHRFGQSCDVRSLRPKFLQPSWFASSEKSVIERRVYLDTSAVLPLYREEVLTPQVEALHADVAPVISTLTEVEIASALARWVRTRELSEHQAQTLEDTFAEDLRLNVFERTELKDRHYWQARHWLLQRKTALRTPDALHLACAVENGLLFVTADKQLAEAGALLGERIQLLKEK